MEFNISDVEISGIEQTLRASGFPMSTNPAKLSKESKEKQINRLYKLGSSPSGSGHDCALKGITVQANITAPQYWWPQFQRYHFADIVSSQSKMHRIMSFNITEQCNDMVSPTILSELEKMVKEYKVDPSTEKFVKVLSNTPMGFYLTARITTNYLQLKGMHLQRRHHKLPEWQQFCDWIETLPYMDKILQSK